MLLKTCPLLVVATFTLTFCMDAKAPLHLLDRHIYDELSEPTETIGRGELVLKEMISYYCNLIDVYNHLRWKDDKGMISIDVLEKNGGPKLPTMEVNGEVIKRAYNWQEKDLEVLTTMLSSIRGLWHKMTDMVYQFTNMDIPHRIELFQSSKCVQKSLTSSELKDHHQRVEKTVSMVIDYYLELYSIYSAFKTNKNQDVSLIEKLQAKEPTMNKALQEDQTHCEEKQMKILNLTLTCIDEMWMFVMRKAGLQQMIFSEDQMHDEKQ